MICIEITEQHLSDLFSLTDNVNKIKYLYNLFSKIYKKYEYSNDDKVYFEIKPCMEISLNDVMQLIHLMKCLDENMYMRLSYGKVMCILNYREEDIKYIKLGKKIRKDNNLTYYEREDAPNSSHVIVYEPFNIQSEDFDYLTPLAYDSKYNIIITNKGDFVIQMNTIIRLYVKINIVLLKLFN
jgi:hypothetical protein